MAKNRDVTELDFRKPEFLSAKVEDYERRDDGAIVRKDRWETGIRQIAGLLGSSREGFEVDNIVDQVSQLVGNWCAPYPDEDPEHDRIDIRLACGSVLAGCERIGPLTYRWPFGDIEFTSKDFCARVAEFQKSRPAITE